MSYIPQKALEQTRRPLLTGRFLGLLLRHRLSARALAAARLGSFHLWFFFESEGPRTYEVS